jgi:hypothetical protein
MTELIQEGFKELTSKYDIKVNIKSKRTFSLFVLEDVPLEVKNEVHSIVQSICDNTGRKVFTVDNPFIRTNDNGSYVTAGIWDIRIY